MGLPLWPCQWARLPLADSPDVCKLQQRGRNTIIICYPNSKSYKRAARKVRQFPPDKAWLGGWLRVVRAVMTPSGHTCTGSCSHVANNKTQLYADINNCLSPRRCPPCSLLWHRLRFFVRRLRVTKLISSVSRRPCRNCRAENIFSF